MMLDLAAAATGCLAVVPAGVDAAGVVVMVVEGGPSADQGVAVVVVVVVLLLLLLLLVGPAAGPLLVTAAWTAGSVAATPDAAKISPRSPDAAM